ncbi:MAG: ribosome silencing factor [Desulfobacterota bacterium]|nr:ribosome silencing factor [Thermodesulfobacteriota bacterium]
MNKLTSKIGLKEKKIYRKKLTQDPKKKFSLCVISALDKKAKDLVVLRVTELSSFADYFLICHGDSHRQVQGIANAIEERMKKAGFIPLGIEGYREGNWILMDYGDIILHIFKKQVREFYDLERLWIDAPRLEINEKTTSKKLNDWWNS